MRRILSILLVLALVGATTATAQEKRPLTLPVAFSLALVSATVADTALTIHGIQKHGMAEANPLLTGLFRDHKWGAIWAIQGVVTAFAIIGCTSLMRSDELGVRIAGYVLIVGLTAFRTWCYMHNARMLRGR